MPIFSFNKPKPAKSVSAFRRAFSAINAQGIFASLFGGIGGFARETFPGEWQISDRYGDTGVPERSPLAHSAVYTSINVISSDIAKLPLRIMRKRASGGGREVHSRHPLSAVLAKPNRYQTSLQFIQNYLASKLWTGNVYVLLFRDARGVVNEMHVLDPNTVTPAVDPEGNVWYLVKRTNLNKLDQDIYIPSRDILHDRAVTIWHPLIGVSPLFSAAVSASVGNRIAGHSDSFFKHMSRASGVLSAPADIPPPTAERLKKEWDNNYAGTGFGKVAVLGAGLEWKPLTMTATDAQLIEQMRWSVEDVGRVYRVPAFMLGETKVTYRNSEQLSRMYFNGCLSYHIESMEQCFQQKFELGPEEDTSIEFDLAPLFRMETDLRYATHAKALSAGIKSINEVRAEEDLPPVKGGEEPRLQMQYVPLSLANQPPADQPGAPKPAAPMEDPPGEPEDPNETPDPGDPNEPAPSKSDEEFAAEVAARLKSIFTKELEIA